MSARLKKRLRSCAWAACLAVAMVSLVPAVGSQAEDTPEAPVVIPATYIGEIAGAPDSARIAFVVEGDKFVAYVCSGDKGFNNAFSRWLRGDVKGGQLTATNDEVELTATFTDDGVVGALKKGKSHEFTAKLVAGNGNAGLFRAADKLGEDDVVFGWIVDDKGGVVGTAGKQKGPVTTLQPPKGSGNIVGSLKGKNGEPDRVVPAGKVSGAANDPKASPPAGSSIWPLSPRS